MPRRAKAKGSLLAPAGSLLRKLSNTDARVRRRFLQIGIWVLVVFFCWSLISGTYGVPRIVRLKLQKEALIDANRKMTAELVDSYRMRHMLLTDENYLEQIARTRFHMVYPGETIYRYRGR